MLTTKPVLKESNDVIPITGEFGKEIKAKDLKNNVAKHIRLYKSRYTNANALLHEINTKVSNVKARLGKKNRLFSKKADNGVTYNVLVKV